MEQKRKVVILSPQPWNHIFISKHHYAFAFSKHNDVWFITGPEKEGGFSDEITIVEGSSVKLLRYRFWLNQMVKFRAPLLYRKLCTLRLKRLIKKHIGKADICFDFGCYQFLDSLQSLPAEKRVFFPVDDNHQLKISSRGADYLFSVSQNVLDKFSTSNVKGIFINHGLSEFFSARARKRINSPINVNKQAGRISIGYSGNLFISFLDIPVFTRIIQENPEVDFHFFGSLDYCRENTDLHNGWNQLLNHNPNVKLHGLLKPEKLASEYEKMDGFILCYKPDYKNYHGENSHKVLEYLSTGKLLISTFLSSYADSDLLNMSGKDQNEALVTVFKESIDQLAFFNSDTYQQRRISFALANTYDKQIERIESVLYPGASQHKSSSKLSAVNIG